MKSLLRSSRTSSAIKGPQFGTLCPQMTTLVLLVVLTLSLQPSQGFLFPDMIQQSMHRSGGGSSVFVIAAIQEEPYLSANGTGYLPDLMGALAAKFSRLTQGPLKFQYEIRPVKTWEGLIERAGSKQEGSHCIVSDILPSLILSLDDENDLGFGLVCPYILRTDPKFSGMHTSQPVIHTSVKYITGYNAESDWSKNMTPPPWKVPKLINVKGSPEDRLLDMKKKGGGVMRYKGRQQEELDLDTLDTAMQYIRQHGEDFLVTDASLADCIVNKEKQGSLQAVCPSRRLSHSGHMFYGFFGRNTQLIKFLNDLLKLLHRNGKLDALEFKHFGVVRQCD